MEVIKNFLPEYKLYECTVDDDYKPALSNIHFSNGYAFASNGFIAVRALIKHISAGFTEKELDFLEGKDIDAKSFRAILGYPAVSITAKGFEVNDDTNPLFFGFNRQESIKFPSVDNLFDMTRGNLATGASTTCVSFNSKYLGKLLKAMNAKKVRFDFDGPYKAILVRSNDPESMDYIDGVLMPINLD